MRKMGKGIEEEKKGLRKGSKRIRGGGKEREKKVRERILGEGKG